MARRTVVVSPNWVGDTVMALPVLEALARSDRQVSVLGKAHLHPLLDLVPGIDGCLEKADSDRQTIASLRRAAFDEAVVLPNSFRSAWLPFRAGIGVRWGYRGNGRRPLLRPAVPHPGGDGRHQVEDYRELLAAMEVEAPLSWIPHLTPEAELRARGVELVARTGLASGGPIVGLFPGAAFGPSKRWPWQRFVELIQELRRYRPDLRLVVLAGPKEVWLGVRIHEVTGRVVPVFGTDQNLAGLAAFLSQLSLLVTNDSGPMHVAAALGVPCVALFGPTDPTRTRPLGEMHETLYLDPWCSPCFRRRCPLLHHRCMRGLEVEATLAACRWVLDAHAPV